MANEETKKSIRARLEEIRASLLRDGIFSNPDAGKLINECNTLNVKLKKLEGRKA